MTSLTSGTDKARCDYFLNQVLCSLLSEGLQRLKKFPFMTFRACVLMGPLSRSHFEAFFRDVRGLSKLRQPFALVKCFSLIESIAEHRCAKSQRFFAKLCYLICNNYYGNICFCHSLLLALSSSVKVECLYFEFTV